MLRTGRSGVLISVDRQKRLLNFDAIQAAQTRGVNSLHQVTDFLPVSFAGRRKQRVYEAIEPFLDGRGSYYLWGGRENDLGIVFARNEGLSAALRLVPQVRRCTGPSMHSIPPIGLRTDGTCRACGYPVE